MLKLQSQWETRLKLYAEGNKLYAEGHKLNAEGNKLYAEGHKLNAEGHKLYAEGDIQWYAAIIEAYGNIAVEFKGKSCVVGGDEYTIQ
jgi:hypothetical protein